MSNLWERFDSIAKPEEVVEAVAQSEPIEAGQYLMTLEELAPAESKSGLPMLKGKFRIVENNRPVFYNQVLQNLNYPNLTAKNIGEAVVFVGGLIGEEIQYNGLKDFADIVSEVQVGTNHLIEVYYDKKDTERNFTKLKVIVPEIEELDDFPFED